MGSSTALKFCIWGFEDSTPATRHRFMLGQYGLEARAIDFTVLILDNSLPGAMPVGSRRMRTGVRHGLRRPSIVYWLECCKSWL